MKRTLASLALLTMLCGCESMLPERTTSCSCGDNSAALGSLASKSAGTPTCACKSKCCQHGDSSDMTACTGESCQAAARRKTQSIFASPPAGATSDVAQVGLTTTGKHGDNVSQALWLENVKPQEVVKTETAAPKVLQAQFTSQAVAEPKVERVSMSNSKRVSVNYEVSEVGPSGIAAVDLFYTRDGQNWQKVDLGMQKHSPYIVDVAGEGLFGFTLVARNGAGRGKSAPAAGEAPMMWVEVDQTKPTVKLLRVEGNPGDKARDLTIYWKAADKNLGQGPVTLLYAGRPEGPWTPIASSLDSSGKFVWKTPANLPPRLMVRVQATDMAGNSALDQTPNPIALDYAEPKVMITSLKASR